MSRCTVLTVGVVLSLVLYTLGDTTVKQYKCKYLKARRLEKIKRFHLYTESEMNWQDGFKQCRSLQMELASIDNEREFNTILGLIKQTKITDSNIWTSGSDLEVRDRWVWEVSKEEFTYFNWAEGGPNHSVKTYGVEHCVELWRGVNFKMNDIECSAKNYLICQYYEYSIVDDY